MSRIEKFNLEFDKALLDNEHFTKHPQMLPYVGDHYEKH